MNSFFVSLIITLLFVGLNTTFVLNYMTNFVSQGSKPGSVSILTEGLKIFVFFILTWLIISMFTPKQKEGFYFEVSKGLPKCSRGYIGRPNSMILIVVTVLMFLLLVLKLLKKHKKILNLDGMVL